MERWLSKPRVMVMLCAVMLSATLNRRDPLVYGLFLFLLTLGALGWALPWTSLRRIGLHAAGNGEVVEGEASSLSLRIEQRGWWPVFMIEVRTIWDWAGRRIVLSQVVPVLRRGRPQDLGEQMRFECRGHYRLQGIELGCSFPLGLFRAQVARAGFDIAFVVVPRPAEVDAASDLPVSTDESALQVTRRLGLSHELGSLRDYEIGEPIRRIHWRASARAGHLIIQQHLQSGSPLLRVVIQIPDRDEVGQPLSAGEQAIRTAAGLCRLVLAEGVRLRAYVTSEDAPATRINDIERGLAKAQPGSLPLVGMLSRVADDMDDGDLVVLVVPANARHEDLLPALAGLEPSTVRVCIASDPQGATRRSADETPLASALTSAGIARWASSS